MKFEELSQAWLEGFCNYILHSHTDHDDNNNYLPEEEPSYTSYKEGAKAGMAFIKLNARRRLNRAPDSRWSVKALRSA
jgi:hypothetical protein